MSLMTNQRTLFTTADVAERLGVSVATVRRMVLAGRLAPATKGNGLRGGYVFDAAEVERVAAPAERGAA